MDATFVPMGDPLKMHHESKIRGARYLDLSLCRDMKSPYANMMPDKFHFVRIMKALGVRKDHTVVVYDKKAGWFATRAAFVLRNFGHPKVYTLDGGFAKWEKEGRSIESDNVDDFDEEYDY